MKRFSTQFALVIAGLVCGAVLSIAFGSARATAWMPNASSAPQNMTETVLHVGSEDQEKGAGLPCSAAGATCGLAVGSFLASKSAAFDGDAYFRGVITGNHNTSDQTVSMLSFGDALSQVTLALSGNGFVTGGGLYSDKIISSAPYAPLCADKSGNIILCSAVAVPPPAQPKEIYGMVSEYCSNGTPQFAFAFDKPTPVSLNMKLAMCTSTYWWPSKVSCWGTDLLNTVGEQRPWPSPSGDATTLHSSRPDAFDITIPSGVTTYSTPTLSINGENAWCRQSGRLTESIQYTYGTQYPYPKYYTLLFKMLNNTDYTLFLKGQTMYKTDPLYNYFMPIIIK